MRYTPHKTDWMIWVGGIGTLVGLGYAYLAGGWRGVIMGAANAAFVGVCVYLFGEWFPWPDPVRRYLFGDDE